MPIEEALAAWGALLGEGRVLSAEAAAQAYGASTSGLQRCFAAALRPARASEVQALVGIAARHRVPLYPISTGRNWGYGCALPVRDGCAIVDLSELRSIRDFDADLGVVTLEPGVTQAMLAEFLDRQPQPFLVPVTGAGPSASIVGNALERGYGITPVADHFGAVQSLEAVLPDGRVYRPALAESGAAEAARSFKWGVGPYLDGLFTQGSLGIVTSMTIALARRPERVKAFLFGLRAGAELTGLVAGVREVLRRFPGVVGGINLMNAHRVLAMAIAYPRERLGADGLIPDALVRRIAAQHRIADWTVFGTLYGTKRVVAAAQSEIRRLLKPYATGLLFVTPGFAERLQRWSRRLSGALRERTARRAEMLASAMELVAGRPNETALPLAYWKSGKQPAPGVARDPARDGCGLLWYAPLVPMKPESVTRYVELVTRVMRAHRLEPLITLTSLSERCFDSSVPLLFDRRSAEETDNAHRCNLALLENGRALGFVPYRVGIDAMGWLTQGDAPHWALVRALKAAVDPDGILAPGRYGPG